MKNTDTSDLDRLLSALKPPAARATRGERVEATRPVP